MAALLIVLLALLLVAYLAVCGWRWGVPEMVSDTYYQGAGKWFTALMALEAIGTAWLVIRNWELGIRNYCGAVGCCGLSVLDCYEGTSLFWTACGVVGCAGLLSVGVVPMYRHCERCHWAHKAAAWVAAIGCLGWCCSVDAWPTLYVGALWLAHYVITDGLKPWYVAEVCAFLDVFLTITVNS